jgi:DNA-binding beta-propeller fold protein YncE
MDSAILAAPEQLRLFMNSITLPHPPGGVSWLRRSCAALLLALLASCAIAPEEQAEAPEMPIWPSPPDLPRFAYETTLRSIADITPDSDDLKLRRQLTGEVVSTAPAMAKPYGIVARYGKIYVTDTVARNVTVFDIRRNKLFHMGVQKPGDLSKPSGIALDKAMNVYVADVTARKVNVYDTLGLYLRSIGSKEDLERPTGVAVSDSGDRIYVIDRSYNENVNQRVVVYDAEGTKLFAFGERGTKDGQFNVPVQGAVGPDGTLYVLDSGNFRVQAFDRDGKFLRTWGKVGNHIGDFARPRGIAVDNDGNVYVTDATFANVQLFNPQGQLLLVVGSQSDTDKRGRFNLPGGVAVDETGRMYVADQFFNKIEVIRRLTEAEGEALLKGASK